MVDESYLRRYFLRDLPQEEQDSIEEKLCTDETFFQEVIACEDDLVDDYARGKLSSSESVAFEAQYLTTQAGQEEVEFARGLADYIRREHRTSLKNDRPWRSLLHRFLSFSWLPSLTVAAEAVAIVLLLCAAILWLQNRKLQDELQKANAENAKLRHQSPATDLENSKVANPIQGPVSNRAENPRELNSDKHNSQSEIALVLTPTALRDPSSSMPSLSLPKKASRVRLLLAVSGKSGMLGNYEADVFDPDAKKVVFHDSHLDVSENVNGPFVVLEIPSRTIEQGEYIVTLSWSSSNQPKEDVASYSVHVIRK
jgi:cell division protein FtsB